MTPADDVAHPRLLRQETCTLAAVRRIAAMLDLDPDGWSPGDLLPRGWQFVLMGADARRSALRRDGFPGFGVPVPDLGLERLMIVGRSVSFHGDIRVGATLERNSAVTELARRDGPAGPSARLTVRHDLSAAEGGEPLLTESQTFIMIGGAATARRADAAAPPSPDRSKVVTPDDTLLFQYSALGFNSHRIHWDRAFAREREGFPDLVVNGGLTTLLLTEFLRTDLAASPTGITARYLAPLFSGRPVTLAAKPREGGWVLRALDDTGRVAVEIEADT